MLNKVTNLTKQRDYDNTHELLNGKVIQKTLTSDIYLSVLSVRLYVTIAISIKNS